MKNHFFHEDSANGRRRPRLHLRGLRLLFQRIHTWNLIHPPLPERIMIKILRGLKIHFEHRKCIGGSQRIVSFYLSKTRQAIQVQGLYDKLNRRKPRTPAGTTTIRELLKQENINCLFISDTELLYDDLTPVIRKIKDFVESSKAPSGSQ